MKFLIRSVLLLLLLGVAYLLAWPTPVAPVVWTAPAAPSSSAGPYALNDR
ncbi:MAG: hypothetical protein JWR16_324, partial [Nevskia sp.]|nr:hypothetical protein [Nevskia sp.]